MIIDILYSFTIVQQKKGKELGQIDFYEHTRAEAMQAEGNKKN